MKSALTAAILLASLFLSNSFLPSAEGQEKLVTPDEQSQKATKALIEEIYADEFAAATTAVARRELASRLFGDALETHDDDAGRFVLLKTSSEIAAESGEMTIASEALHHLLQEFDVNKLELQASVYAGLAGSVRDRSKQRVLAEELLAATYSAIRSDQFDLARKLVGIAQTSARKSKDIAIVRRSTATAREIDDLEEEFTEVARARLVLKKTSKDSSANQLIGSYLCFVNDNWEAGVPMLARSTDPVLESISQKELSAPANATEQSLLGDELWSCAQGYSGIKRETLRRRAVRWYADAHEELSGLSRAKVESRLAQVDQAIAKPPLPKGAVLAFDFEPQSMSRRGNRLTLADLSTGKRIATIENGRPEVGVHGSGLSLRGDGFIKFPDKALPGGDAPRSYLLWARIDELPVREILFAVGELEEGNATYLIVMEGSDSQGRGHKTSIGNPGGRGEPCGKRVVADGKWHHFALVYDGNGTAKLYVDGELDLTHNRRYSTTLPGDGYVGNLVRGAGVIGAVDDFIVFDRPVAQDEIVKIKDESF